MPQRKSSTDAWLCAAWQTYSRENKTETRVVFMVNQSEGVCRAFLSQWLLKDREAFSNLSFLFDMSLKKENTLLIAAGYLRVLQAVEFVIKAEKIVDCDPL